MARKYTPEQRQFFIDFVPGHSHKEIAEEFNRRFNDDIPVRTVKSYISNNKLNTGRTGRYEKGHVPWSKGRELSPERYARAAATMFKKGQSPPNKAKIGDESIDKYGYTWVKVSDFPYEPGNPRKNWKLKQRLIWEQAHGPIPEGMRIIFLDGDKTNLVLDNLAMVPQKVLSRLNQNHLIYDDPEVTKSGIAIAEVLTKIGELEREKNNG